MLLRLAEPRSGGRAWMRSSPASISWFESQFVAVLPQLGWFEDAGRGDDASDQFGRGHVKTGIAGAAHRTGYAHILALAGSGQAPGTENFILVPLLDRDVAAA